MSLNKHFLNIPSVYRLGTKWINKFPLSVSYSLSQGIADLSFIFYKDAVENVKKNLSIIFPIATDDYLSNTAKQIFRNYSKYLVDYARLAYSGNNTVIQSINSFEGKENLNAALKLNKGLILLTAHLGNWELGGIFFSSFGMKTNVVTISDNNPDIDNIRRKYRENHNVNTITVGNSPFSIIEMMKALNNNEVVAMLIDRYNASPESSTVNFFNKQVPFPNGPFVLSRLTGSPIVTAFVISEKNSYKGIIGEPFVVINEKDEYDVLNKVVKTLEKYILLYPDQWYNFSPI